MKIQEGVLPKPLNQEYHELRAKLIAFLSDTEYEICPAEMEYDDENYDDWTEYLYSLPIHTDVSDGYAYSYAVVAIRSGKVLIVDIGEDHGTTDLIFTSGLDTETLVALYEVVITGKKYQS